MTGLRKEGRGTSSARSDDFEPRQAPNDRLPLAELLARVQAATGPDTGKIMGDLHDRIWRWVNDNHWNDAAPGWEYDLHDGPDYTASLDAALSLVERCLPGAWPGFQKCLHTAPERLWSAWLEVFPENKGRADLYEGRGPTAPLAILEALLTALSDGGDGVPVHAPDASSCPGMNPNLPIEGKKP